jgi:hypothetical protein
MLLCIAPVDISPPLLSEEVFSCLLPAVQSRFKMIVLLWFAFFLYSKLCPIKLFISDLLAEVPYVMNGGNLWMLTSVREI